ncbi:hypothetical protein [Bacillus sp. USDA818B3_A]|uniref:hypothetical protein n=1 Tax=Bacillus sp. USDA818B3_A TaxID=2698834 RepID=UPI00136AECF9|nr:hypothetical protein [Bacillus sp. USDA818B3_A]
MDGRHKILKPSKQLPYFENLQKDGRKNSIHLAEWSAEHKYGNRDWSENMRKRITFSKGKLS